MTNGITISINLSQIAVFFTVAGIGTIVVGSLLLDRWVNLKGWSVADKIIGCSSIVIIGGIIQALTSAYLYIKIQFKQTWIYTQIGLILLFIICFSILLADSNLTGGTQQSDAFFAVVGVNWILMFLIVGLLSKNSVPVGILFSIFGVGVIITCSLVIDDYANATGSPAGDKMVGCSAAALVAGFAQTISSAFLFAKDDMKNIWMYTNGLVTIVLVICFSIPMAGGIKGYPSMDYYYSTLAMDFVFLFVVVGMFLKNKLLKN